MTPVVSDNCYWYVHSLHLWIYNLTYMLEGSREMFLLEGMSRRCERELNASSRCSLMVKCLSYQIRQLPRQRPSLTVTDVAVTRSGSPYATSRRPSRPSYTFGFQCCLQSVSLFVLPSRSPDYLTARTATSLVIYPTRSCPSHF